MIEVKHLTKYYGDNLAVNDVSFTLETGSICGFLGPNGAGKTTTLNIISGYLSATDGHVSIGGYDVFEQPEHAKALIGYLPETPPLYPDMTPLEQLKFVADLKGMVKDEIPTAIFKVVHTVNIDNVKDRLNKFLSKGYKQRVGLACALLGEPPVLILDEPTIGLDPRQITEMRAVIRDYGKEHTVIFSTHILSEVQTLCDKVVIISKGRLIACEKPSALSLNSSGNQLKILVKSDKQRVKKALSDNAKVSDLRIKDLGNGMVEAVMRLKGAGDARPGLSKSLVNSGCIILSMEQVADSLEDVFLNLTEERSAEK